MKHLNWTMQGVGVVALGLSAVALWRVEHRGISGARDAGHPAVVQPAATATSTPAVIPATPVTAPAQLQAQATPATPRAETRPVAPAHTAPAASGELRVRRLVVARGVENRAPVEPGTAFALAQAAPLYAYVEMENRGGEDQVVVTFERDGAAAPVGLVHLDIPAQRRWRTWGLTRMIRRAGAWSVVVRDTAGHELARQAFEVTAS